MSSIMVKVIHGAVNTLIVCWAESPESFRDNHKDWADKMTVVWSATFPGSQNRNGQVLDTDSSAETTNSGRYGATGTNIA